MTSEALCLEPALTIELQASAGQLEQVLVR